MPKENAISPHGRDFSREFVKLGAGLATGAVSRATTIPVPAPDSQSIDTELPYKPLDFDTYEIRLLQLQWDREEAAVSCALEYASLIDPGPYIALSYCWGDLEATKRMNIGDFEFNATENLVRALQAVRKLRRQTGSGDFTRLWVDAVCINQKDAQERSHQVRNMRQIYSRAQEVISFVGSFERISNAIDTETDIAAKARLKIIHGTSDWEKKTLSPMSLRQKRIPNPKVEALETRGPKDFEEYDIFFSEAYWRRAWVIQEITVGAQVSILYGNMEFQWEDVAAFFTLLKRHAKSQLFPRFQKTHGLDHLLEFRERFFIKRTPISLFEALNLSRKALATDPRDKIFALLGLCHDGTTFVPVPNYRQSLESIIADMSKNMMMLNKSLDAICLRGVSQDQSSPPVPTWAPNWQRLWIGGTTVQEEVIFRNQDIGRVNPILEGSTNRILKVRGTRVGAVTHLTSAMKPHDRDNSPLPDRAPWISLTGTLAKDIPELGRPSPDISMFYSAIWKTLTMGLSMSGMSPRQAEQCFSTLWMPNGRGSIHDLNLIEWIDRNAFFKIGQWTLREWSRTGKLPPPSNSSSGSWADNLFPLTRTAKSENKGESMTLNIDVFTDVLRDVLGSGMRLACLDTRQYFIGMVHPDTQEGDKVFYLQGCSVPVILRKDPDPDSNQYTVVGSAYLDDALEWGRGVLGDTLLEDLTLC
ncbi:heterokaryon incompatibility protein-domain-containing protein [Cadophora sp. MPI-SDFR-AT-0126]|nr:heterokaryon incompatibility protein-domain-containing protein [Leotiomycetes sp. MPI-SDFR-AT-0126]